MLLAVILGVLITGVGIALFRAPPERAPFLTVRFAPPKIMAVMLIAIGIVLTLSGLFVDQTQQ